MTVSRGLRANLGLDVHMPVRLVRDRVRYLDLARRSYAPPNPGLHHRNETLSGLGDPQVALHFGEETTSWGFGARVGISIPVGRTEPNPFELGRLGLRHQHIQFGSGTWDPILGVALGRAAGPFALELSGNARLTFAENEHGLRAGHRYGAVFGASPHLGDSWHARAGLALAREESEKWDGRIEEEGNLGRTDLFLSLGGGRAFPPVGMLSLSLQVPLASESTGEQVEIPVIVSLTWAR